MKIGVIGAGTMGQGIAHAFAVNEEYEVALCDLSEELARKGKVKAIAEKIGKVTVEAA